MQKVKCSNANNCKLQCNHKKIHRYNASSCNAACRLGIHRCLTKEMVTHNEKRREKEPNTEVVDQFVTSLSYSQPPMFENFQSIFDKSRIRQFKYPIDFDSQTVIQDCMKLHQRLEDGFLILANIQNHENHKIHEKGMDVVGHIVKDIVTALNSNDLLKHQEL